MFHATIYIYIHLALNISKPLTYLSVLPFPSPPTPSYTLMSSIYIHYTETALELENSVFLIAQSKITEHVESQAENELQLQEKTEEVQRLTAQLTETQGAYETTKEELIASKVELNDAKAALEALGSGVTQASNKLIVGKVAEQKEKEELIAALEMKSSMVFLLQNKLSEVDMRHATELDLKTRDLAEVLDAYQQKNAEASASATKYTSSLAQIKQAEAYLQASSDKCELLENRVSTAEEEKKTLEGRYVSIYMHHRICIPLYTIVYQ